MQRTEQIGARHENSQSRLLGIQAIGHRTQLGETVSHHCRDGDTILFLTP